MKKLLFFVCNVFIRALHLLSLSFWAWYHILECQHSGVSFADAKSVRFDGKHSIVIKPGAKVIIGKGFTCRSDSGSGIEHSTTKIIVDSDAHLTIGDHTGISNSILLCKQSLYIGNQVLIGGGA